MEIEKNVLKQYVSIKEEIADLERRNREDLKEIKKLEKQIVSDTVTGSREDLTIGPIMIKGVAEGLADEKREKIRRRIDKQEQFAKKLLEMKKDIEEYIQNIKDSEIRRIARFRYIDDLEWRQVAVRMGKGYSADACRKKIERFLEKNKTVRSCPP